MINQHGAIIINTLMKYDKVRILFNLSIEMFTGEPLAIAETRRPPLCTLLLWSTWLPPLWLVKNWYKSTYSHIAHLPSPKIKMHDLILIFRTLIHFSFLYSFFYKYFFFDKCIQITPQFTLKEFLYLSAFSVHQSLLG